MVVESFSQTLSQTPDNNEALESNSQVLAKPGTILSPSNSIPAINGSIPTINDPIPTINVGPIPTNIEGKGETEAEFTRICKQIVRPIKKVVKEDIIRKKKHPIHFWHSLAFVLSDKDTSVAVSSFFNAHGENKLYIASNDPMTSSQQSEVTEIINMFLDLKPLEEITAKLWPRHLPYIIKQFYKMSHGQLQALTREFPGPLSQAVKTLHDNDNDLSMDDIIEIRSLLNLIVENKKALGALSDGLMRDGSMRDDIFDEGPRNTSKATRKMAHHLCKMDRIWEDIDYVRKKIKHHQQNPSLKTLSRSFEFISLNCHAELALLKTAKDCCASKSLYIGVSKRPCYCCFLFFKAVKENKSTDFKVYIVPTHGKLYGTWNRIENFFEKEFNQVWAKVIQETPIQKKLETYDTSDSDEE